MQKPVVIPIITLVSEERLWLISWISPRFSDLSSFVVFVKSRRPWQIFITPEGRITKQVQHIQASLALPGWIKLKNPVVWWENQAFCFRLWAHSHKTAFLTTCLMSEAFKHSNATRCVQFRWFPITLVYRQIKPNVNYRITTITQEGCYLGFSNCFYCYYWKCQMSSNLSELDLEIRGQSF